MSALIDILLRGLPSLSGGEKAILARELAKLENTALDVGRTIGPGGRVSRLSQGNIIIQDGITILDPDGNTAIRLDNNGDALFGDIASGASLFWDVSEKTIYFRGGNIEFRNDGTKYLTFGTVTNPDVNAIFSNNGGIAIDANLDRSESSGSITLSASDSGTEGISFEIHGDAVGGWATLSGLSTFMGIKIGATATPDATLDIAGNMAITEEVLMTEMTEPAAPSTNQGKLYLKDVGGKTTLCARFATGAVQVIASEP